MPELPEVQTVVDQLFRLPVIGRTISAARVYWPRTIADADPDRFCRTIAGCTIDHVTRRGKYIVMQLSRGMSLLIHLRMTGRLVWTLPDTPRHAHEHVTLLLDGRDELRFHDPRKFGRLTLTATPQTILDRLGPEPLSDGFTARRFAVMLAGTRRPLKPLLLDQHFLAGLGNIYVDEALWQSALHPLRRSHSLGDAEIRSLHRAIRHVLRKGVENMGTSLGSGKGNFFDVDNRPGRNADKLKVFRRTGCACPRCGAAIERIVVGQRSTHFCPCCQNPPS